MQCSRAIWLLVVLAGVAGGGEAPDAAKVMEQIADYRLKSADLKDREKAYLDDAQFQQGLARGRQRELANPFDASKVAKLRTELSEAEQRVARYTQVLMAAEIRGAEARATAEAEAEATQQDAANLSQTVGKHFDPERTALREEWKPIGDEAQRWLENVGRTAEELNVIRVHCRVSMGMATVTFAKEDGWPQATLTIHFPDSRKERQTADSLPGGYPIISRTDYGMMFRVGDLRAYFLTRNKAWHGKEKVRERVLELVDLEQLAAFAGKLASDPEYVQSIESCLRRSRELGTRQDVLAAPVHAWATVVGECRSELRQAYDPQRVTKWRICLDSWQQSEQARRAMLFAALIQNPEEREAEREKARAQEKEASEAMANRQVPFAAERAALKRESRFAAFYFWELTDRVVRVPSELGIVEGRVDEALADALVGVRWSDAHGRNLIEATIGLTDAPLDAPGGEEKLVGKYSARYHVVGSRLAVRVGHAQVLFHVHKKEWQTAETLPEVVPMLLDLDGIASWPPLPTDDDRGK